MQGVGDVLAGRVEQGSVKPGDEVLFLPTHTTANPCFGKVSIEPGGAEFMGFLAVAARTICQHSHLTCFCKSVLTLLPLLLRCRL